MSELLTLQDLANGHLDVKALGEAANGDENTIVTTRTGNTYPSAERAINIMFQNGGLPATPFATKDAMDIDGASLAEGALAIVYNDKTVVDGTLGVNNGLYSKSAGNFVRTTYDVSTKINAVDEAISKTISLIADKDFTLSGGYFANTGQLMKDGSRGYQYSSPIALKRGDTISFEFYGAGISALIKTNQNLTTGTSLIVIGGVDETTKRFAEYRATSDMFVAICSRTSQGALQPKLKSKNVLESDALKDVSQSFDDIQEFVSPKEPIGVATNLGGFDFKDIVQLIGAAGIDSVDIILSKGDVLTFDYQPVAGTNLWDWVGNTGYPLLSFIEGSIEVKSHRFVAANAMTARITNAVKSSIKVNGVVKSGTDVLGWAAKLTAIYSIAPAYKVFRVSLPFSLNKGDTIVITKVAIGGISLITTTGGTTPTRTSLYARNTASDDTSPLEWTADAYCLVQVCGMADSDFYIRRKTSFTLDERITSLAGSGGGGGDDGSVPDFMTLPVRENVFATSMNYILKTELIDNVDYIKISTDLGKTWTQMPNILGDIVSYHFFSDGTIMLCSPTKVYWTRDYLTLNESTVYDHDGSVFVPTGRHFFTMQTGDSVQYIDNQEIFVFADYLTVTKPRIWYSLDRGRTIKCAALFGTTVMDGSVRDITHVHRVYYHKKSQTFYITTGDYGNGNMIMKAVYNVATDTWTWDVLATGIEYKFGNITIDDNNIAYLVTDYTEASLADKKGIYRVPVPDLGDITKYQRIYHADTVTWGSIAPLLLIMDKNGNKVLLPDYLGKGFIWVARDGLDFVKVRLSEDVLLQYAVGANYKGDIYCIDYYANGGGWRLNRGSFNLTKMLRDAGVSDFMRGTTIIPNLPDIF